MIYFDNAATSGFKPITVKNAVENALKNFSANPGRSGHKVSVKTADAVFSVRNKIANFFGATGPENVIFTLNCTHSINIVLKGVLKKGDHVIISGFEHNAVLRPLKKIGVSFDVINVNLEDEEIVRAFENKIKVNTRLIFCTGASNVFGKIMPIKKLGELCRKRDILFGVDAAQTAGVLPIKVKEMNIDFLCVAAHKGLYAPMGIGILIAEKMIANTIIEGGTGTNSLESKQPDFMPEKFESGTINVPGIMGISGGIDFVEKIGLEKLYNHEMHLTNILYNNLKQNPNIKLYTDFPKPFSYVPVISFNFLDIESEKTAIELSKRGVAVRGGYHCSPLAHKLMGTLDSGTVRVSLSVFNTEKEISAFSLILKDKNFEKSLKSY